MAGQKNNTGRNTRPAGDANRLAKEASPYLLQHADNPVHWSPWGPEAFARAAEQDKPIFLSIGYSTCHWCHVMERESFEDDRIAGILNEHFVSIKVDREERPDVDDIYMHAVQMMTGTGGWPLSVFLTPDRRPFYGGTYFPPEDMMGRPGFDRVLLSIAEAWENKREQLLASSEKIMEVLTSDAAVASGADLDTETLNAAKLQLERIFDGEYGGFGMAPKFPQPSTLLYLLRHHHRTGNPESLEMVTTTLDRMAAGGIYDHLAGGFHRYSTDRQWLVPHFEKMLYDQALIARAYVEAYQVTGRAAYAEIARGVFDYVLADLTDESGGFYAGRDADSEGAEGTYYVWTPQEIRALLDETEAAIFAAHYGVSEKGNFESGRSVLSMNQSFDALAEEFNRGPVEIERIIADARAKLLTRRRQRPKPHRDDKIITSWNGLMIWSLAHGGRVLDEPRYVAAARKAADFIVTNHITNGRLHRYSRNGSAVQAGFLDDYACSILALHELYEATFDARRLVEATTLADAMIDLFHDSRHDGFFLSGSDAERVLIRRKPAYDGAVPSENSIATLALLKLGHTIVNEELFRIAARSLGTWSTQLNSNPTSLTAMLMALDYWIGPRRELVIRGQSDASDTRRMMRLVHSTFLPRSAVVLHEGDGSKTDIRSLDASLENKTQIDNRATAYVCRNFTCRSPVNEPNELKQLLAN